MAYVEIAVGLRREARMYPAFVFIVADVFRDDLTDEIRSFWNFRIVHLLCSFLFGIMFLCNASPFRDRYNFTTSSHDSELIRGNSSGDNEGHHRAAISLQKGDLLFRDYDEVPRKVI